MRKSACLIAVAMLAGCSSVQPLARAKSLILKTKVLEGTYVQATIPAYDRAAIHHLKLELFPLSGGLPQAKVSGQTLLNAQLDNPVVINNLKPGTSYRIQASAYSSSDDSQLISLAASSSIDVVLTNDDRPLFSAIPVVLVDRAFIAQATSSLTVVNGGFSPLGNEDLWVAKSVSTLAGGSAGFQDGFGTAAKFSGPRGLTLGPDGNLYSADCTNHVIRRISTLGYVSTVVGSHATGFQDGTGTLASLNQPTGVAFDASGNMYVAEWGNNCIRKVTPAGVVTTLAGNGTIGTADGTGTNAQFNIPAGIVYSPDGYLYVVERDSHRIRKVSTLGVVTSFVGGITTGTSDGTGTLAKFNAPHPITVSPSGDLYVGDVGNHRIRKITPQGVVTTVVGSVSGNLDGTGTAVRFNSPYAVAYAGNGLLYIGDNNHVIRKMDANNVVTTLAGNGTNGFSDGVGTEAKFYNPRGMVVDAFGNLYVSDMGNLRIRKVQ